MATYNAEIDAFDFEFDDWLEENLEVALESSQYKFYLYMDVKMHVSMAKAFTDQSQIDYAFRQADDAIKQWDRLV